MEDKLNNFLSLNGQISEINSDSFLYSLKVTEDNLLIIKEFYDSDSIESLSDQHGLIIIIDNLANYVNQLISIEFVISEINKIGFFLTMEEFILSNRFEIPSEYFIKEINVSNSTLEINENFNKYRAITNLIISLTAKSKFVSEEFHKNLCLVQDNSIIEIPVEVKIYEDLLENCSVNTINQYIEDIDSYQEKKTIFLKELIDFLSNKNKGDRFSELVLYFDEFYEKCTTSFEYYLSNFSYSKIKLELDNSVLEYSKNLRSIINDSQSKLIAIPAAFILASSQIDYSSPFILKNLVIIFSSFLFSYIISIFIKNQINAIEIISDNLYSYKKNYKRSKVNTLEEARDLNTLSELIEKSFQKTELEITKQKDRLNILQFCNWGISVMLVIIIIFLKSTTTGRF